MKIIFTDDAPVEFFMHLKIGETFAQLDACRSIRMRIEDGYVDLETGEMGRMGEYTKVYRVVCEMTVRYLCLKEA